MEENTLSGYCDFSLLRTQLLLPVFTDLHFSCQFTLSGGNGIILHHKIERTEELYILWDKL